MIFKLISFLTKLCEWRKRSTVKENTTDVIMYQSLHGINLIRMYMYMYIWHVNFSNYMYLYYGEKNTMVWGEIFYITVHDA